MSSRVTNYRLLATRKKEYLEFLIADKFRNTSYFCSSRQNGVLKIVSFIVETQRSISKSYTFVETQRSIAKSYTFDGRFSSALQLFIRFSSLHKLGNFRKMKQ